MAKPKKPQPQQFFDKEGAAEFLGMSLPEFLLGVSKGEIPVKARPKNPTPVYYRCDLEKWDAAGRPFGGPRNEPRGW